MATQTFRDFDAFAGAVRDADGRFMLTHPVERKWVYTHRQLNRISLQCGHEESGGVFEGSARRGGCLLFVETTSPAAHTANGRHVRADSITVIGSRAEACFATRGRTDWFSIFVPSDVLAEHAERYHFDADAYVAFLHELTPSRLRLARLRAVVDQLEVCDRRGPWLFDDALIVSVAESELLNAAISCLDPTAQANAPHCTRPHKRAPRDELVRLALAQIDADVEEGPVRIGELADAADVSERTLRNAFTDYFGVSPVRYIKLRQLYRVRRALASASLVQCTVTEIESQFGISEFGRFAHEYHALFGELPSQTLAGETGSAHRAATVSTHITLAHAG